MAEPLAGREDDLDDHNYQVHEVYAQYGLTSYESQVMEKGVVNALALNANFDSQDPTQHSFDVYFDKFAKYTLGRLLTAFETAFPDDVEAIAALKKALPLRNFIAHNYFWDHATAFMSCSGRERMLAEVIEMRGIFATANALVGDVVRRVAEKGGITREQFEHALEEARTELREQVPED